MFEQFKALILSILFILNLSKFRKILSFDTVCFFCGGYFAQSRPLKRAQLTPGAPNQVPRASDLGPSMSERTMKVNLLISIGNSDPYFRIKNVNIAGTTTCRSCIQRAISSKGDLYLWGYDSSGIRGL